MASDPPSEQSPPDEGPTPRAETVVKVSGSRRSPYGRGSSGGLTNLASAYRSPRLYEPTLIAAARSAFGNRMSLVDSVALRLQVTGMADAMRAGTLVDQVVSPSYLASLNQAFDTSRILRGLTARPEWISAFEQTRLLSDTVFQSEATVTALGKALDRQASFLTRAMPDYAFERPIEVGLRAFSDIVRRSRTSPSAVTATRVGATGRGTLGLLTASAALLQEDGDDLDLPREEASLLARREISQELARRLRELDPLLPALLEGAWDAVAAKKPTSAMTAANLLIELIDWSLRQAAPNEDVLRWHSQQGRPASEIDRRGLPVRTLRARYVLRDRRPDQYAARLYLRGLSDLVSEIQAHKHDFSRQDIEAVARLVPTVEGLLVYLFL